MLSIGAMGKGQGAYYLDLAREDYYLEGGEPPGKWWGAGAEHLGLRDTFKKSHLKNLLAGFGPDNQSLIQNAGKSNHQPGWDLTFSAVKSVSVLWSQADEQTRRIIQEAHHAAVTTALQYLQEEASVSRRGKGGMERKDSAGLIVATFEHGTSRAHDPQLHTHALVLNIASRPDGTTGALVSKPLYKHKMAAGALYRCQLAYRLAQDLGVTCRPEKTWFEIEGVPNPLIEEFSKRRRAIEKELGKHNLETASSAAAAAAATLATRKAKGMVPPRGELFATWRKAGEAIGFSVQQVIRTRGNTRTARSSSLETALKEGIKTLTKYHSHFTEIDLVRRTAEAAQTLNLPAKALCEQAKNVLAQSKKVVLLGERQDEKRYTSAQNFEIEKKLERQAKSISWGIRHGVPALVASRVEKAYARERTTIGREIRHHASQLVGAARRKNTRTINRSLLSKDPNKAFRREHVRAFRHMTMRGKGGLRIVDGIEGTEKSSLYRAVRDAYEKAGYTVLAATPSKKAACLGSQFNWNLRTHFCERLCGRYAAA